MEYCGLDLGRRSSRYCIVDNARDVVQEGNVRTHKTHLRRVFSKREPMRIVVEATTACFWVADQLIELGHDVRVVDPNQTKAIGVAFGAVRRRVVFPYSGSGSRATGSQDQPRHPSHSTLRYQGWGHRVQILR
jgi:hypothetical protein